MKLHMPASSNLLSPANVRVAGRAIQRHRSHGFVGINLSMRLDARSFACLCWRKQIWLAGLFTQYADYQYAVKDTD
jgi:hypothetical protein